MEGNDEGRGGRGGEGEGRARGAADDRRHNRGKIGDGKCLDFII